MSKFKIELDDKQMRVICDALDMYSRMGMGQLDVAVEEFLRLKFYNLYHDRQSYSPENGDLGQNYETHGYRVRRAVDRIKHLVFGHPPNGSWGIHNEKVPWDCREAYDIKQVLRKTVCESRIADLKAQGDEEGIRHQSITVSMSDYLPTHPEFPPVKAQRLDERTTARSTGAGDDS